MKLTHIRANSQEHRLGLGQNRRVLGIRIFPEEFQSRRNDLVGGIKHVDAAIGEPLQVLRLEDHFPGIQRGIGHALLDLVDVVGDAGCAPKIRNAELVAGIVLLQPPHDFGIKVFPVRQLGSVERPKDASLDLPRQKVAARETRS